MARDLGATLVIVTGAVTAGVGAFMGSVGIITVGFLLYLLAQVLDATAAE